MSLSEGRLAGWGKAKDAESFQTEETAQGGRGKRAGVKRMLQAQLEGRGSESQGLASVLRIFPSRSEEAVGSSHLQAEGDGKGVLADLRREVVIGTDRTASETGQSKKT